MSVIRVGEGQHPNTQMLKPLLVSHLIMSLWSNQSHRQVQIDGVEDKLCLLIEGVAESHFKGFA